VDQAIPRADSHLVLSLLFSYFSAAGLGALILKVCSLSIIKEGLDSRQQTNLLQHEVITNSHPMTGLGSNV
jgi:hypothetical protein